MHQKGNILFLILLAVVLFAALSYAVTQSLRGGGKDASSENADTVAADIIGWFGQLDTGVMRMTLTNDISMTSIDFNDPANLRVDGVVSPFDNTNCATTSCEVFSTDGGNVTSRNFNKSAGDTVYVPAGTNVMPGYKEFIVINTPNLGTSLPDIAVRIAFVKKEVCNAVNRRVGISENLNAGRSGAYVQYMGPLTQVKNALASTTAYTWSSPEVFGKNTFCDYVSSGPFYQIYHVIVER